MWFDVVICPSICYDVIITSSKLKKLVLKKMKSVFQSLILDISVIFIQFSLNFRYVVAELLPYRRYIQHFSFRQKYHSQNFDWNFFVKISLVYVLCLWEFNLENLRNWHGNVLGAVAHLSLVDFLWNFSMLQLRH